MRIFTKFTTMRIVPPELPLLKHMTQGSQLWRFHEVCLSLSPTHLHLISRNIQRPDM